MPFSEEDLKLMDALMAKPKARDAIQGLIKENFPEFGIPEYEAKKQIRDEFKEAFEKQQKEMEELRAQVRSNNVDREWEKQAAQIKKTLGWDDVKLAEFQKAFAEEFKDKKMLEMADMAEYYELKNRPLSPSPNPRVGPFGIRQAQSSAEAKWREDVRDPKSPMFSKNKRERKAYWRTQWQKAKEDMHAEGVR